MTPGQQLEQQLGPILQKYQVSTAREVVPAIYQQIVQLSSKMREVMRMLNSGMTPSSAYVNPETGVTDVTPSRKMALHERNQYLGEVRQMQAQLDEMQSDLDQARQFTGQVPSGMNPLGGP